MREGKGTAHDVALTVGSCSSFSFPVPSTSTRLRLVPERMRRSEGQGAGWRGGGTRSCEVPSVPWKP